MATKEDIVKALATESGESQVTVAKVLSAMPAAFVKELNDKAEVRIPGLLIAKAKYMPAREYVDHMHGGKKVKAAERMRVHLKTASTLAPEVKVKKAKKK